VSALPPKADMCAALVDVCYGPKADIAVVSTYRADPTSEVFYKRTPGWPVFSRAIPRACKTSGKYCSAALQKIGKIANCSGLTAG
jgi:hypothetical protein